MTPGNSCDTSKPVKEADSLVVDPDGNRYPVKTLSDGNLWMTANLGSNIPDSYCYDDRAGNGKRFGRLYTWESARRGCVLLGEGWRLPTEAEWARLTSLYGGMTADSIVLRKRAYKVLLADGGAGFNAVLGGNRDPGGNYVRGDAHGFYWTITENDSRSAWYYNFAKGSQALFRQDGGEKERAFSVRCVKSIHQNNLK